MPITIPSIQALIEPTLVNTAGNNPCGIDWVRKRIFIRGATGFLGPQYLTGVDMLTGVPYTPQFFGTYTTPSGGAVNGANAIATDGQGNLYMGWFGGSGGGLTKVDGLTLAQLATGGAGTGPPLGFFAISDSPLANIEVGSTEFFLTAGAGGAFANARQYGALNQCVYAGRSGTYAPTVASGGAKGCPGKIGTGVGFLVSGPNQGSGSAQDFYLDKMTFSAGGTWTPADWPTQNPQITHSNIRIYAPSDFDPSWTQAYCKGICCDQTDGNPIVLMADQTAATGLMCKLDKDTGSILWTCVTDAPGSTTGGLTMSYSLITRQRMYLLFHNKCVIINTSDGSSTFYTTGLTGVLPFAVGQCCNDAMGAVLLSGSFSLGAGSPTPLTNTPVSGFGGWGLVYVDQAPIPPPGNRRFLAELGPVRSLQLIPSPIPSPPVPAAGSIAIGLDVTGVGSTGGSAGTINLAIDVAGYGSAGGSAGSIALSVAVAGVGAGGGVSAGSVNLSISVSGVGAGGSASLLKTLTIQNTSASPTAPFSHTPTFGLLFKKGDIPAGTYPVLQTAGGSNVPYTYWNKSTWSDGSLKFLPVLARFPDVIAGNSSASLNVYSGGGSQSASNRTLAEVYAENITIVGSGLDNIAGVWTCDLQAANVIEAVSYGDGPAGRIWRFLCNFKQSGSAHGQLVTYFYLQALQDNAGNIAGWRVMPRVTQPYYNFDTPAKIWRSFTSLKLQYGSGPTTIDPMANYSARTFVYSGSGNTMNCTANGYTSGVACRLTTTGTLPTGLSTGTTYWINQPGTNTFVLGDGPAGGGNQITISGAGTGTHTFTPIPYLVHFGTYWATATEKYVYFQGAGSVASDPTLRVQADKTYDHSTKVLPPYNLSIGTVTSNTSYTWAPYQYGPLLTHISGTGERDDIGVIDSFHVRHFYTQAAVDERLMRIIGLAQGLLPDCFKDHATLNYANFSANAYAGMPASVATSVVWRPSNNAACGGFTLPAGGTFFQTQCFEAPDISHQTQYSAYPYIVTGEPQYFDLMMETAGQANFLQPIGDRNFTVGGNNYKGIGPAGKDTYRSGAWSLRDIIWPAALSPDVAPDGSASSTYIRDLGALQFTYMVDWLSTQNAYWASSGFWGAQSNANGRSSWQIGYLWQSTMIGAGGMENANALTMATHFSKWPPNIKTLTGNLWCLATYYEISSSSNNTQGPPFITANSQWGPWVNVTNLSWAISGNLFTWTGPNFLPSNGDKVMFWTLSRPGSNFTYNTQYYAVNTAGNTFQLAATPGGTPIVVQANGDLLSYSGPALPCFPQFAITCIPANPPSSAYEQGSVSQASYGANQSGCVNWALALGISTIGLPACSTELIGRQVGVNYTSDPKYAMQTTF